WESPRVDLPDAPFYVQTSPETTAFHQFLGLTPSRPSQPLPEVMQKEKTYSCLVEEMNDSTIRGKLERADRAFKAGTTRSTEDRFEQLAIARRLYMSVLQMDRTAYIPALLCTHAALGKEQYEAAMDSLLDAVKRHPGIFAERPDIAAYFGEAEVFDEQCRKFLRAGETSAEKERSEASGSSASWIMQSYCAWQL